MQERTFPAVLSSLGGIRDFVRALAAPALEDGPLYKLVLAVDELATNVIEHGYGDRGLDGRVHVLVNCGDDHIQVTLLDDAPPFDASAVPPPPPEALTAPLHERTPGGLGLVLIRDGVDIFHYERIDGCNRNTLIKRFR